MEKTLTIDGRQIKFKSSGGNLMRYRNQFNADFLVDISMLRATENNYKNFSYAAVERIIWTLAKTADPSIPDPQTWYDSFDSFPFKQVFSELAELIKDATETIVKNE